eukprot:405200-Rhodomonas_salina.3
MRRKSTDTTSWQPHILAGMGVQVRGGTPECTEMRINLLVPLDVLLESPAIDAPPHLRDGGGREEGRKGGERREGEREARGG